MASRVTEAAVTSGEGFGPPAIFAMAESLRPAAPWRGLGLGFELGLGLGLGLGPGLGLGLGLGSGLGLGFE